jgi:hypothetical protein
MIIDDGGGKFFTDKLADERLWFIAAEENTGCQFPVAKTKRAGIQHYQVDDLKIILIED